MRTLFLTAAGAAVLLGACSSKPREFAPSFASSAVDVTGAQKAAAVCKELYAKGKLNSEGRLASAGMGAAAGGAMGVAGGAAATSAGLYGGGVAIASATVVLIPFAVIGGAVGMAKIKRGKKERAIQQAMAGCLQERGYQVAGWERVRK